MVYLNTSIEKDRQTPWPRSGEHAKKRKRSHIPRKVETKKNRSVVIPRESRKWRVPPSTFLYLVVVLPAPCLAPLFFLKAFFFCEHPCLRTQTRFFLQNKDGTSDGFGLSSPIFQKMFQPKLGIPYTSIVARFPTPGLFLV